MVGVQAWRNVDIHAIFDKFERNDEAGFTLAERVFQWTKVSSDSTDTFNKWLQSRRPLVEHLLMEHVTHIENLTDIVCAYLFNLDTINDANGRYQDIQHEREHRRLQRIADERAEALQRDSEEKRRLGVPMDHTLQYIWEDQADYVITPAGERVYLQHFLARQQRH